MLLRTLGAEFSGEGTDEAGLQVVRRFLVEAGIEDQQVSLGDGCGLSRENLVTPRFQTSLLKYISTRPYFGLFLGTLAVSGTDGTLKNRMTAEPCERSDLREDRNPQRRFHALRLHDDQVGAATDLQHLRE